MKVKRSHQRLGLPFCLLGLAAFVLCVCLTPAMADDKPTGSENKPVKTEEKKAAEKKTETPPLPPDKKEGEGEKKADDSDWPSTENGVKYQVLKAADGPKPQKWDKVKVHMRGMVEDGDEFINSFDAEPWEFRLQMRRPQQIKGVEELLMTMSVGEKRLAKVPSSLGYGLRGAPPKIPANATLVYEIELLGIEPAPKMTETKPEQEVKTDSGLRYVDLKPGTGEPVKEEHILTLQATTWSPEGELLNTSLDRDAPIQVPLGEIGHPVIKEGISSMKVGGKRKLLVAAPTPPTTQPAAEPPPLQMIIEIELVDAKLPPEPPKMEEVPADKLTTTESGLQYYDFKVGEGDSPEATSVVEVHYTGWLTDGTMFDSSVTRGTPATFPLNRVIAGWTEGLQSMKVGGKRRLVIPSELGYGAAGAGQRIPPNSTLIFNVELISIQEK